MRRNYIYIINGKYYTDNYDKAVEKAKEILRDRSTYCIKEDFTITKGKRNGYCVHLNDNWEKVGNTNLLNVIIKRVELL